MSYFALSTNYPYWQDILFALKERGIEVSHALAHGVPNCMAKCSFYAANQTNLVEGYNFYRLKDIRMMVPRDAAPLDRNILDYFAKVERDFYTITDRYAYFPLSFRQRKRIFRQNIRYWLNYYQQNNFQGIISTCAPHNLPEFVAFHAAKYLGLKIIMPKDVMINDHVMIANDYSERKKVPADFLQGKSEAEVKAQIRPLLLEKAFEESAFINLSRALNDKALGVQGLNTDESKAIKVTARNTKPKAADTVLKKPSNKAFKAPLAMNGIYTITQRRIFKLVDRVRLYRLKKDYEKLAITPDMNTKYIYFAMNLQPERTTQPEAESFEDHLLAIDILAKAAPDHTIYVKENPTQYSRTRNTFHGRHYRDKSDYMDILRHKNVKLVKQNIKSTDLIKSATFNSSIKGSVGWESIMAGKPAIVFANAWYGPHQSCYEVTDVESCKQAFAAMAAKSAADVKLDTLKYLAFMQNDIIAGSMGGHHNVKIMRMEYQTLVDSVADEYAKRLKQAA
jgi:hypothetical protein